MLRNAEEQSSEAQWCPGATVLLPVFSEGFSPLTTQEWAARLEVLQMLKGLVGCQRKTGCCE